MKRAKPIILDIDNCIADDGWRIPHIRWDKRDIERYHEYHLLAPMDEKANAHIFYNRPALVLTARPVAYRLPTEYWLKKAGVQIMHLLMRNNEDFRTSLEVKRTQVEWLLQHYDVKLKDIMVAYDDRPEICAMYRKDYGINAEQVFIHQLDAYREKARA